MSSVSISALPLILRIYRCLISFSVNGEIPVRLRSRRLVGMVQDDPFDNWVQSRISSLLPKNFEVVHSGPLTTPDLVIRDKQSGFMAGLEIKKLVRRENGRDPRGITMDFNSSLPCGATLVKVGAETIEIPCFYFFALLSEDSGRIVSSVLLDGDFLNYDFNLHKESKYSNYTEYNHGPYGEGSVRHRKMYTYPNPLNSRIDAFSMKHLVVAKKADFEMAADSSCNFTGQVIRVDKYGNSFYYYVDDELSVGETKDGFKTLTGIFDACKVREPKERVAAMPVLAKL